MMKDFDPNELKKLYIPPSDSHKGQNGKLLLIGGSQLFHAASLWSLKVASRIVDMVYYSSIPQNNEIIQKVKEEFRDGIVVPRNKIEDYIQEADCILIGPGLPRPEGQEAGDNDTKKLTERLLRKYPAKKWVIDGGSLQLIDPALIPNNAILTPHHKEFEKLFSGVIPNSFRDLPQSNKEMLKQVQHDSDVARMAKKYNCTIVLKGPTDIVCSSFDSALRGSAQAVRGSEEPLGSRRNEIRCVRISGGNAGMTKGGTGDVLAGLIAALYCKNDDPFLVATAGSYLNKKAGESLFARVGYYLNASDLADELPKVMKKILI